MSTHSLRIPLPTQQVIQQMCPAYTLAENMSPPTIDLIVGYGAVDRKLIELSERRIAQTKEVMVPREGMERLANIDEMMQEAYRGAARANANHNRASRIQTVYTFQCGRPVAPLTNMN